MHQTKYTIYLCGINRLGWKSFHPEIVAFSLLLSLYLCVGGFLHLIGIIFRYVNLKSVRMALWTTGPIIPTVVYASAISIQSERSPTEGKSTQTEKSRARMYYSRSYRWVYINNRINPRWKVFDLAKYMRTQKLFSRLNGVCVCLCAVNRRHEWNIVWLLFIWPQIDMTKHSPAFSFIVSNNYSHLVAIILVELMK